MHTDLAPPSLRFEKIIVEGYEQVFKVVDVEAGLVSIIAIHNSSLGPALGGIRIQPYASFDHALKDALRLSKGMTYKAAMAGVGLGGGKSVILADPKKEKTEKLLLAFGSAVEQLNGQYVCAEDAGSSTEDVQIIRRVTRHVVGLPHAKSSGDPSVFTAWGVFRGIQATAKKLFGTDSLNNLTIAIQGLGSVGSRLASHLFWAGADLIFSDVDMNKAISLADQFGATVVLPEEILKVSCDILVPCAFGGMINDDTVPLFSCRAIAGAANNQLEKDSHADALLSRGILYAPDFVINAGGLLNVAAEVTPEGYHPSWPRHRVNGIYDILETIYQKADENRESTQATALALASDRIRRGIGKRTEPLVFHHLADFSEG